MPTCAASLKPMSATPPAARAPVLVLGLGNVLLRDEGIGVHVIRALEHSPGARTDVELWDGGTAGFALLDVLAARRRVIVVDAVDTGAAPGTIVRLTAADLAARPAVQVSLHELGLADTLLAARRLGIAPTELVIIGIQPEALTWGLELSPTLARRVPELIRRVLAELDAAPSGSGS